MNEKQARMLIDDFIQVKIAITILTIMTSIQILFGYYLLINEDPFFNIVYVLLIFNFILWILVIFCLILYYKAKKVIYAFKKI